jgi:hypothetical protein
MENSKMTKQKDDGKPVGSIEFVRMNFKGYGRQNSYGSLLEYNWIPSGKPSDHWVTADKMQYKNCYAQLEVGQDYLIVCEKLAPERWVWTRAFPGSKAAICKVTDRTGLLGIERFTGEQMEEIFETAGLIKKKAKLPVSNTDKFFDF